MSDEPKACLDVDWKYLTDGQKALLIAKGINENNWTASDRSKIFDFMTKTWKNIDQDKKTYLEWLGYNQASWDSGDGPLVEKTWEDLNDEEKLAARNLSLTKSDFDGIFDTTFEQIATRKWNEIDPCQKVILEKLGLNKDNWEAANRASGDTLEEYSMEWDNEFWKG